MNRLLVISLVVTSLLMVACKDKMQRLPSSSARPYEVMVVGDVKDSINDVLSADVDGLPQPEPMFDVSKANGKGLDDIKKMARAIVIFDKYHGDMSVRYNLYAQPQIVINASPKDSVEMRNLLMAFEMKCQIETLRKKHNAEIERYIKRQFGVDIVIPAEMTSTKKAKNFLWISNNSATAMKNIVIMKGNVNELLRKNLKGETDSMFVELMPDGLWQMKNDAMGGPYRLVRIPSGNNNDKGDVVCLAFAYAPESKKRNIVRQLEAVLNTIKYYNNGRK